MAGTGFKTNPSSQGSRRPRPGGGIHDQNGAAPLAPHEAASLDQIAAGLQDNKQAQDTDAAATPAADTTRDNQNTGDSRKPDKPSRMNPDVKKMQRGLKPGRMSSQPQAPTPAKTPSSAADSAAVKTQSPSTSQGGGLSGAASGTLGGAGNARNNKPSFMRRNRKKLGFGGGLVAVVTMMLFGGILGLAPLKLIDIRELYNQYFGARQQHISQLRVGKIWQAVADKDGNIHYARNSGHPLRDAIYNVNTKRLISDMKERGIELGIDPKTGHITQDGKPIDGSLKDRRSVLRQTLHEAYPEDNAIQRSLRTRRVFKAYGISYRFFENSHEKVKDWETEVKGKIRRWIFGEPPDATLSAVDKSNKDDPNAKTSAADAKALDDLNSQFGADVAAERAKDLSPSLPPIQDVDTNIDPAKLAEDGAKDSVKGALNATAWLSRICNIKNTIKEINIAAKITRAIALSRYAGMFDVAADQIKSGDDTSIGEVDALAKQTDNIEQSDGWKLASGQRSSRVFATAAKYSLDLSKSGTGGAFFTNLNKDLDSIPGGGATCAVATNVFFQIGSTIGTVAVDIFTAGGPSLIGLGVSAAVSFATGAVEDILKPMAIQMLAGESVNNDEPGKQKGDALFGGNDIIFNQMARAQGGQELNSQQVATLDNTITAEKAQANSQISIANRLFDATNPNSLAGRLTMATPSSFTGFATMFTNFAASLNPASFEQALISSDGLLAKLSPPTNADVAADSNDPLGVGQEGLTDGQLTSPTVADPVANEAYILDNPGVKQQWLDFSAKCFNSAFVDPGDEKNLCNQNNPLYDRFRVYQEDLGLGGDLEFMTGSVDQEPDVDAGQ